jgi:ferredoxin
MGAMTTYLATLNIAELHDPATATDDFRTDAFCSTKCRLEFFFISASFAKRHCTQKFREDDFYEFDETCSRCGDPVPASPVSVDEILSINDAVERLSRAWDPTPPLLL